MLQFQELLCNNVNADPVSAVTFLSVILYYYVQQQSLRIELNFLNLLILLEQDSSLHQASSFQAFTK